MNNHTAYSYHNYTINHTILAYSNFMSVYHSCLLLKQWILKLYKICITEYFSLPYDFTSEYEGGATGLLRPLSGIYCFFSCPAIIYYIYKNIRFVNLHKISRAFLCNIFIDISGVLRIMKAYRAKQQQKKHGGTKNEKSLE